MGAHLDRARILRDLRRYDLAEKELRDELAEEPGSAYAHALLADALHELSRPTEALTEIREAIRLSPGYGYAHRLHGYLLGVTGDREAAVAAYAESLRLEPSEVWSYEGLAYQFHMLGRQSEALEITIQGLKLNPNHVNSLKTQGLILTSLERFSDAEHSFTEALRIDPDSMHSHQGLGVMWSKREEWVRAIECFRESLRLDSTSANSIDGLRHALVRRANALHKAGRSSDALLEVREALRLSPDYAYGHQLHGYLLAQAGERVAAIDAYTKSIQHDPGGVGNYSGLAFQYYMLGRQPDALRTVAAGLKIDPKNVDCLVTQGRIFSHLSRFREAEISFNEALRYHQDNWLCHNALGLMWSERLRWNRAVTHLRAALQVEPADASSLAGLRSAILRRANFKAAPVLLMIYTGVLLLIFHSLPPLTVQWSLQKVVALWLCVSALFHLVLIAGSPAAGYLWLGWFGNDLADFDEKVRNTIRWWRWAGPLVSVALFLVPWAILKILLI